MDIRRFGPGHRRPDGPPGTQGVSGQTILSDEHAVVTELAFSRYGAVTPHVNQANSALFIVIGGTGFVQVGAERARVNHGEAVLWPAGVMHGAYTDGTEMRAIVVEMRGRDNLLAAPVAARVVSEDDPAAGRAPSRATGSLADRQPSRDEYDADEGEPW